MRSARLGMVAGAICVGGFVFVQSTLSAVEGPSELFLRGKLGARLINHQTINESRQYVTTLDPTDVRSADGRVIGVGEVVALLRDEALAFLPTVVELTHNGQQIVLIDALFNERRGRAAFGYLNTPEGPTDFFTVSMLTMPTSSSEATTMFELRRPALVETDGPTMTFAFYADQAPAIRMAPGLNTGHRTLRWHEVVPPESRRLGDNFNVSAATPDQAFVTNLSLVDDQRAGFFSSCTAPNAPCAIFGFGAHSGRMGRAIGLNPADSGLPGPPTSMSSAKFIRQFANLAPAAATCPSGKLDPPASGLGGQPAGGGKAGFAWEAVDCADSYVLQIVMVSGHTINIEVAALQWFTDAELAPIKSFRVAAVNDGVPGDFSGEFQVWDPNVGTFGRVP